MNEKRNQAAYGLLAASFLLAVVIAVPVVAAPTGVDYDIVYVRAPRSGDNLNTRWPEVKDPILAEPGTDLMLLHPDGSEEVLVPGGNGAVVDPTLSFDGQWVYYAKFHDVTDAGSNYQRRDAPFSGSDIYRLHLGTRFVQQLTHQDWTPNTGAATGQPITFWPILRAATIWGTVSLTLARHPLRTGALCLLRAAMDLSRIRVSRFLICNSS